MQILDQWTASVFGTEEPISFQRVSGNFADVFLLNRQDLLDDKALKLHSSRNEGTSVYLCPKHPEASWLIRWFNTEKEIQRCGHGALAAAQGLWNRKKMSANKVVFETHFGEKVICAIESPFTTVAFGLNKLLDCKRTSFGFMGKQKVLQSWATPGKGGYLIIDLQEPDHVFDFEPDFKKMLKVTSRSVILAALDHSENTWDAVFRYFAPAHGVNEDAATGSAAAVLSEYYYKLFQSPNLKLFQASTEGGFMFTKVNKNHVAVTGLVNIFN